MSANSRQLRIRERHGIVLSLVGIVIAIGAIVAALKVLIWICSLPSQFERDAKLLLEKSRLREEWDPMQEAVGQTIEQKRRQLIEILETSFLVQPCFRCHELQMRLLEVSPNGRSIHYDCRHCRKSMHAAAATPDAHFAISVWNELNELANHSFKEKFGAKDGELLFHLWRCKRLAEILAFVVPVAPLPYEQTSRTPISEAIRSEVWRRDGGRCVQCESKQNLQFDHIIPHSRGGATSVANLQLLCQSCNLAKRNRI